MGINFWTSIGLIAIVIIGYSLISHFIRSFRELKDLRKEVSYLYSKFDNFKDGFKFSAELNRNNEQLLRNNTKLGEQNKRFAEQNKLLISQIERMERLNTLLSEPESQLLIEWVSNDYLTVLAHLKENNEFTNQQVKELQKNNELLRSRTKLFERIDRILDSPESIKMIADRIKWFSEDFLLQEVSKQTTELERQNEALLFQLNFYKKIDNILTDVPGTIKLFEENLELFLSIEDYYKEVTKNNKLLGKTNAELSLSNELQREANSVLINSNQKLQISLTEIQQKLMLYKAVDESFSVFMEDFKNDDDDYSYHLWRVRAREKDL